MTWKDFFAWLEQNGVKYAPGDIHYAGRGYWFPVAPEPGETPSGLFILVEQDRSSSSVFISASPELGEGKYAETPEAAKEAVDRLLMAFFTAQDAGLAGFHGQGFNGRDTDVSAQCDDGFHSRCSTDNCVCSCHRKRLGAADFQHSATFKTCTACGRKYTRAEWAMLPLLGMQKVEADEETGEPACVFVGKNCTLPCTGTMYAESEVDDTGTGFGAFGAAPKIARKLATAGSLEDVKKLIAQFYASTPDRITLIDHGTHWQVQSGERVVTPIVVQQGKRFIFGVGA